MANGRRNPFTKLSIATSFFIPKTKESKFQIAFTPLFNSFSVYIKSNYPKYEVEWNTEASITFKVT